MGSETSKIKSGAKNKTYEISCFGHEESGKSTFIYQLKRIHKVTVDEEEFKQCIYLKIVKTIAVAVDYLLKNSPELVNTSPNKDTILKMKKTSDEIIKRKNYYELYREYLYYMVLGLYHDPMIRNIIEKDKNLLQINDGVH